MNDVKVGGTTDFENFSIQPEAGKIVIFPSTWNMFHRGVMPISNDKYILTGWIWSKY